MKTLKYKVIKNRTQYKEYCKILEELVFSNSKTKEMEDEIDLLTMLLEKWDDDHNTFEDLDPVELLRALMEQNRMKAKDLVKILGVSKGLISDILHYKKGFSKEIIRRLADRFKLNQEAFNRPYRVKSAYSMMAEPRAKYKRKG